MKTFLKKDNRTVMLVHADASYAFGTGNAESAGYCH